MGELVSANQVSLECLPLLSIGAAGRRTFEGIRTKPGRIGIVAFGPYWRLLPGTYCLQLCFVATSSPRVGVPVLVLEVFERGFLLGYKALHSAALPSGQMTVVLRVPTDLANDPTVRVEFRIRLANSANILFTSMAVRYLDAQGTQDLAAVVCSSRDDWLPLQQLGEAGEWTADGIRSRAGHMGFLFYGPYRRLLPGRYRIHIALSSTCGETCDKDGGLTVLDVVTNDTLLACYSLTPGKRSDDNAPLDFLVTDKVATPDARVEIRLRLIVPVAVTVRAVTVTRLGGLPDGYAGDVVPMDWLALQSIGKAGMRVGNKISTRDHVVGCMLYGPYVRLPTGSYSIEIKFECSDIQEKSSDARLEAEVAIREMTVAVHSITQSELGSGRSIVEFHVPNHLANDPEARLEFRVWVRIPLALTISALVLRPIAISQGALS